MKLAAPSLWPSFTVEVISLAQRNRYPTNFFVTIENDLPAGAGLDARRTDKAEFRNMNLRRPIAHAADHAEHPRICVRVYHAAIRRPTCLLRCARSHR